MMTHRQYLEEFLTVTQLPLTKDERREKLFAEADFYDIILGKISEDCIRSNIVQLALKFLKEENWRALVERNRR